MVPWECRTFLCMWQSGEGCLEEETYGELPAETAFCLARQYSNRAIDNTAGMSYAVGYYVYEKRTDAIIVL